MKYEKIKCARCKKEIIKTHPMQKYCDECRVIVYRIMKREASRRFYQKLKKLYK